MNTVRKGVVRQILSGGKLVLIAHSHSMTEVTNDLPDLRVGDKVLHDDFRVIKKFDVNEKPVTLKDFK
jgi:hypothetical protein